jgi:hypothetical protein
MICGRGMELSIVSCVGERAASLPRFHLLPSAICVFGGMEQHTPSFNLLLVLNCVSDVNPEHQLWVKERVVGNYRTRSDRAEF